MRQQINLYLLLPEDDSRKVILSKKHFIAIVGFFIGILLMASLLVIIQLQKKINLLKESNQKLNLSQQMVDNLIAKYPGLDQTRGVDVFQQKYNQINQIQAAISSKRNPATILAGLSAAVGQNLWLESIQVTDGGGKIELRGKSTNITPINQLMANLAKQPIFAGVSWQIIDLNQAENISFLIVSGANNL